RVRVRRSSQPAMAPEGVWNVSQDLNTFDVYRQQDLIFFGRKFSGRKGLGSCMEEGIQARRMKSIKRGARTQRLSKDDFSQRFHLPSPDCVDVSKLRTKLAAPFVQAL